MKQVSSEAISRSLPQWQAGAALLSAVVVVLALIAWGNENSRQFTELTAYDWFPLFGLLAFSLLWAQYVTLAISSWFRVPAERLRTYFRISGYAILAALVAHPSLLIWRLWKDGLGLPPESYLRHFVAPGLEWAALLGSFSLFIFLAYELHRWYAQRSWWRFIFYASDAAMLAIIWHGFALGGELQAGWYHTVWIIYSVTLLIALAYLRLWNHETRYHF